MSEADGTGIAGARHLTLDFQFSLSVEQISNPNSHHHDGAGDVGLLYDASVDELRSGLVVGNHVADGARVFLRTISHDAAAGNRIRFNK